MDAEQLRAAVLKMSDRPGLCFKAKDDPGDALRRLDVKPGLTGLWQAPGRADIGFDRMIEIDSAYARSRTLLLDFTIMALTLRAVLSGRGSYRAMVAG
ncbi:MAG: hypothetical protein MnENMB40S_12180 [Rhizobiaceae bacterium MnEN-MB40S]|nr:MAG: hypothetical protein MnENMB40S_12180 [Rhizobiaceae bacterium MnEN-MB40S]